MKKSIIKLLPIVLSGVFFVMLVSCNQMNEWKENKKDPMAEAISTPFNPLNLNDYGELRAIEPEGYFAIAIRFVHPPRVEWKACKGAVNYRLLLLQEGKVLGATSANASPAVAIEGWEKSRPGKASIVIEGFDMDGKRIALSRMFPFYIVPDFSPKLSAEAVRTPSEAAWLAFDALSLYQPLSGINLPQDSAAMQIPAVVFSATVGPTGQQKLSYPVLHDWIYVDMCVALLRLPADSKVHERVRSFARGVGEHILRGRLDAGNAYGGMILGCTDWMGEPVLNIGGLDEVTREKTKRLVEPAKCAYAAEALLKLHEMLGEPRFYEAALEMAEVLARTQAENGSWPTRVDGKTGEVLGTYGTSVAAVISFFNRLQVHYPDKRWTDCSSRAMEWMIKNPMKTYGWVVNYEDGSAGAAEINPYVGLSNWDLFHFVRHVAANPTSLPDPAKSLVEQMEWNDNQFVFYDTDPLLPFDPWVPSCAEQGNPSSFISPGGCWLPMDFHTANWGRALLAMHRLTREPSWMEKAHATSATLTRYQLADGRTLTWMPDRSIGLSSHVFGAGQGNFWPAGWATSATFWAELAYQEENGN